ncbi:MAG: photosynthetic reaction center cytochrome PufC [Burkholderiales bacterium]
MIASSRLSFVCVAVAFGALVSGCERPPVNTVQHGFRGTGMVEVYNPRTLASQQARNVVPAPIAAVPSGEAGGPPAGTIFKNVKVLNDLNVAEFTRLMTAMTAWVAPDQGCPYCHAAGEDLSSDALYTKVVARRMLEMTRHINADAKSHVGATGVTCFTCHRGQPVPAYVWFTNPGPVTAQGPAGNRAGQNFPAPQVGLTSLPFDPFTPFLDQRNPIRVVSTTALPAGNRMSIKQTEWTYALMVHMSDALGVNCTYCHNSRSFAAWDGSTPQRATAYYGIYTVRELNDKYLDPLRTTLPANRLGPEGDAPKVNCTTCHQGAYKPLYGAPMLRDYPELARTKAPLAAAPTPAPEVTATLAIVYFAVASPDVAGELPSALAPMVALMKANAKARATISGYHSATGDAVANHELAKTRAMNVQAVLVAQGIPATRLVMEKPVVEQANVAGEDPKARRVEVKVAP